MALPTLVSGLQRLLVSGATFWSVQGKPKSNHPSPSMTKAKGQPPKPPSCNLPLPSPRPPGPSRTSAAWGNPGRTRRVSKTKTVSVVGVQTEPKRSQPFCWGGAPFGSELSSKTSSLLSPPTTFDNLKGLKLTCSPPFSAPGERNPHHLLSSPSPNPQKPCLNYRRPLLPMPHLTTHVSLSLMGSKMVV